MLTDKGNQSNARQGNQGNATGALRFTVTQTPASAVLEQTYTAWSGDDWQAAYEWAVGQARALAGGSDQMRVDHDVLHTALRDVASGATTTELIAVDVYRQPPGVLSTRVRLGTVAVRVEAAS